MKNDKEVVMVAVTNDGWALQYASSELRNDNSVVFGAVKNNGNVLEYASDELKNDKDFMMKVVPHSGCTLRFASDELKNDVQVVVSAVKQNPVAIRYASASLLDANADFILQCVGEVGANILSVTHYDGKSVVVPLKWKDDFEVMVRAVKLNRDCLEYVSDRLKNDEQFKQAINC